MTPFQYAKTEFAAGRFPSIMIEPGISAGFWLHDGDFKALKGKCYTSREAAEKDRSKILTKAQKAATN